MQTDNSKAHTNYSYIYMSDAVDDAYFEQTQNLQNERNMIYEGKNQNVKSFDTPSMYSAPINTHPIAQTLQTLKRDSLTNFSQFSDTMSLVGDAGAITWGGKLRIFAFD